MADQGIGRYEILHELGRGGMAVVYLASDPLIRRDVAIKVLPQQFTFDPMFRARFEREAQIIAALDHPAIVPIYDFGEHDGQPYIVMRYMPSGSLADRLRRGPLYVEEISPIIERVSDALDEAHTRGIVHRDLKPANILFDSRGEACLSDFGIAKLTAGTGNVTGNALIGTPEYMSPEQVRAAGKVDGRSDVYSLGVVVFHALTGQLPFKADTPLGMAMAHLTETVPSVVALRPRLPSAFDTIILRAMSKDPANRYPTATALSRDVNRAASGRVYPGTSAPLDPSPPVATAPDVWTPSTPPTTEHRSSIISRAASSASRPTARAQPYSDSWRPASPDFRVGVITIAIVAVLFLAIGGAIIWGLIDSVSRNRDGDAPGPQFATTNVQVGAATVLAQAYTTQTAKAQIQLTTGVSLTATRRAQSSATEQAASSRATATAIAKVQATALAASRWPVTFSDGFSTNYNGWPTGSTSDEFGTGSSRIANGVYRMEMTAARGVVSWSPMDVLAASRLHISVEAKQTSGTNEAYYGILLRYLDQDNFYIFEVSDNRRMRFSILYRGEWNVIHERGGVSAIVPGQANRLAVAASGTQFVFYINDQYAGHAQDSRLSRGIIGLVISLPRAGDSGVFEFDNLELRTP